MKQTLFMMFLASMLFYSCQKVEYLIKENKTSVEEDFVELSDKALYPLYPINKKKEEYTITWDLEDGLITHSDYPGQQFRNYYHWWYTIYIPEQYCHIEISTGAGLNVGNIAGSSLVIHGVKPSSISIDDYPYGFSEPFHSIDGLKRNVFVYTPGFHNFLSWCNEKGVLTIKITE